MRFLAVRTAVAPALLAAASAVLVPASAAQAAAPAALKDLPLPFLWPGARVFSVAAVSDTEAWVAGGQGHVGDNTGNPVVRRRVGSEWKEYPLEGWSGNGDIAQVAAYGGEVWAWGVQDGKRLYLARFDGTAFRPVVPPAEVAYAEWTRLWAGPAGVWIQIEVQGEGNELLPSLFRRVGNGWKADPLAGQLQDGLQDLQARSGTEAWTGSCRYNTTTQRLESLALRWNGSTWTALPPLPTDYCVSSVAPAADGTVWALTWNTLYRWNGTAWTAAPSGPFNRDGQKVRLDAGGNPLVVVDYAEKLDPTPPLRYANGTWQAFTTPVETWTNDLSVAPSGRIWVAGSTRFGSPEVLTS
ncbi:hypothetical protein [Actinomadura rupiterrae]|uniref:hypothetical protein n=1 Tax=Actinomadura rupiterrae TaxID=559627 RepID=UPI0020A4CA35|nr:hypothetical protein [Actinomadura rupiterrae]MCP2342485.1 hypothetical protein [Actinomadura rupiterrae]